MGKAEVEIQAIVSHLKCVYWHHTDTHTGITYKPHGAQWLDVERNVHRLLVLRGTINLGDKVPEDPWELFLSEYAPANTRRPDCEKMPSASYQSFPQSILLAPSEGNRGNQQQQSVTVRDGHLSNGHFGGEQQQQQQGREPRRHIRFEESPTTGRMRAPRRLPASPAPRARSFFD